VRPSAPLGCVHVWRAGLDGTGSEPVLRSVLSRYLDASPGAIELEIGSHGKPRLAGGELEFNLSNSAGLALIAVSEGREVGVDVERIEPRRDFLALAERALGPEAVATLRATPGDERAHAFYDLWVRHEAGLKCGGGGLGGPRPEWPIVVTALPVDAGYAAALAVAGPGAPSFRCFSLERG